MIEIPEELKDQDDKNRDKKMLKKFGIGLILIFIYSMLRIGLHYNPWAITDFFTQGHFVRTGNPNYIHADGDTATLLKDGRVLVVGGDNGQMVKGPDGEPEPGIAGAEIYNPKYGTFYPLGNTVYPRWNHTSTLLNDGRVLIVGGLGSSESAEIFDPVTNKFSLLGNMVVDNPSKGILLNDDRVFFVYQIYDPKTNKFYRTGEMNYPRGDFTATLLKDGRVLIAGGVMTNPSDPKGPLIVTSIAEIYDPQTNRYTLTGSMNYPRQDHTTALLPDGKVLIAGGYSAVLSFTPNNIVYQPEIYNPVTGIFTKLDKIPHLWGHIYTTLKDGEVLMSMYDEGEDSIKAVIYDPATGNIRISGHKIEGSGSTATLLQNGKVLFTGGHVSALYVP